MPAHGSKWALFGSSLLAGAAVVKGRAIKRGASVNYGIHGTAASVNLGIAMDSQDTVGKPFPFAHRPGEVVEAEAGAAVALDAPVTSDSAGRLVTATSGQAVTGYARQAATATGDLIAVELVGRGITVA